LALLVLAIGPGSHVQPAAQRRIVSHSAAVRHLTNGLTVAVIEDHAAPVVEVAMYYRFGSLDEIPGKTGLAHALEHMMFRGTAALSGAALDDVVEQLGDAANGDTNEDYTRFVTTVPATQLGVVVHIEADRMRGLLLREKDWRLEQGAVLAEMDDSQGQPYTVVSEAARQALFAGSPFAHDPYGSRRDVTSLTASDLRLVYRNYYIPNNAVLVITGDVASETAFAQAEAQFGKIPAGQQLRRKPFLWGRAAQTKVVVRGDSAQALVDEAFRMPGDLAPDSAAANAFADAIDSDNSPFRQLINDDLVLNITVDTESTLQAGILHVVLWLTPEARPDVVDRAFRKILSNILKHGLDPELLEAEKAGTASGALRDEDSVSELSDRYGYALAVEGHDPDRDDADTMRLDQPAMHRVISRWFSQPAITGVLLPTGKSERIVRSLRSTTIHDRSIQQDSSDPVSLPSWARDALEKIPMPASRIDPALFVFPDGLRLFVQRIPGIRSVVIKGEVATDARFDPPGKTGTGRLLSTLMRDGSRHYDSYQQNLVSDLLGADITFGFSFGAHGRTRDMAVFLDVLADALRFPSLSPVDVDGERGSYRDAAIAALRDPDIVAERALDRALYAPGDPELRVETPASIGSIDIEDLRHYQERYVRPDRTTIVVAGDVDPHAVRAAVNRTFGGWQSQGVAASAALPAIPPTEPVRVVVPANREESTILIGKRAAGANDPAYHDLLLLDAILGGRGRAGARLMNGLRTERGLVYEAASGIDSSPERGILRIRIKTHPENVSAAESIARNALRSIETRPVSATELARAKRALVASQAVSEESTETIADSILTLARLHFPRDYYLHFSDTLMAPTPSDLRTAARRILGSDAFAEAIVGRPVR
jgi:zinc protease